MTFAELRTRIFKYWWVVILSCILFTVGFLPFNESERYTASITLGMSLNNSRPNNTENSDVSLGFVEVLPEFSTYLSNRFSSIEIQDNINQNANLGISILSQEAPFYDVSNSSGGFVNLSVEIGNRISGDNFLREVKNAYQLIIDEWNNSKPFVYQVTPMTSFNETVVKQGRPLQIQILPTVIGLIIGFTIILFLPLKSTKKD